MGACNQQTTEEILDFFYDQGGMLSSCFGRGLFNPLTSNQATSLIPQITTSLKSQRRKCIAWYQLVMSSPHHGDVARLTTSAVGLENG